MVPIELLWLFLSASLVVSFLCSLFLFRLGLLSNHDFRTLFRDKEGNGDQRDVLLPFKIELSFRQMRILSYTLFFSMAFWLMVQEYRSVLVSFHYFLLGMLGIFLLLWTVNVVLPRLLASWLPTKLGNTGVRLSELVFHFMYPLTWLAISINSGADRTFREDERDQAAEFEEEIRTLIDEGEKKGLFDEDEGSLFQSLVEFSDTIVREVMTPRLDIVAIEQNASISELIKRIIEFGFSRIPVYHERIDNIVGVVFAKDLLVHWDKAETEISLSELIREAYFVPETKKITHMLKEFQRNKNHMAIIVDEYGGVSGLVTIEDLLEEIVGEIRDEYDNETDEMEVLEDKSLKVDARINVEEVEDYFDLTIDDIDREDFDTIGGLIFHILGRVPLVDEEIIVGGLHMTVLSVEERRVRMIHIKRHSPTDEATKHDNE